MIVAIETIREYIDKWLTSMYTMPRAVMATDSRRYMNNILGFSEKYSIQSLLSVVKNNTLMAKGQVRQALLWLHDINILC